MRYNFCSQANCTDGAWPEEGGLIMDEQDNLYGTRGYCGGMGHEIVFRLAPDGTETVNR
jgi:hypothetical protein